MFQYVLFSEYYALPISHMSIKKNIMKFSWNLWSRQYAANSLSKDYRRGIQACRFYLRKEVEQLAPILGRFLNPMLLIFGSVWKIQLTSYFLLMQLLDIWTHWRIIWGWAVFRYAVDGKHNNLREPDSPVFTATYSAGILCSEPDILVRTEVVIKKTQWSEKDVLREAADFKENILNRNCAPSPLQVVHL